MIHSTHVRGTRSLLIGTWFFTIQQDYLGRRLAIDTLVRRKERKEKEARLPHAAFCVWKQEHSGGLMHSVIHPSQEDGLMLLSLCPFSIFFFQERDEEIQKKRKRKEKRNWSAEVTIPDSDVLRYEEGKGRGKRRCYRYDGRANSWLLLQPIVLIPSTHKFIQWKLLLNLIGIALSSSCRSLN